MLPRATLMHTQDLLGLTMSTLAVKTRREEYSELTRRAILASAEELFSQRGYEATGTGEICETARVTKGALYHHFADKRALFEELVLTLHNATASAVEKKSRGESDPWKRLLLGFDSYLSAISTPSFLRIVIIEAPAVLGVERYREVDQQVANRLLVGPLKSMQKAGLFHFPELDVSARAIGAIVMEAAMMMSESKNPRRVKKATLELLAGLLGLYRPGKG